MIKYCKIQNAKEQAIAGQTVKSCKKILVHIRIHQLRLIKKKFWCRIDSMQKRRRLSKLCLCRYEWLFLFERTMKMFNINANMFASTSTFQSKQSLYYFNFLLREASYLIVHNSVIYLTDELIEWREYPVEYSCIQKNFLLHGFSLNSL